MNLKHQAKRGDLWAAWGMLGFWNLAALAFFAFVAWKFTDLQDTRDQNMLLVVGPPFFLFWISLSIYSLPYNLKVTDDLVEKSGIFRHRKIDLNRVTKAHWHGVRLRGKLSLQTAETKISFSFYELTAEQARELILFFRRRFPETIQKGWERYWEKNWPLFDVKEILSPEEYAANQRTMFRRLGGMALLNLLFGGVLSFLVWLKTGEIKKSTTVFFIFFVGFQCFPMLILFCMKYFVPKTVGRIDKTQPQHRVPWVSLFFAYAGILLCLIYHASKIFPHNSAKELFGFLAIVVLFTSPLICSGMKKERLRKQWNREAAQKAAELYLEPSLSTTNKP